ncbi:HIL-like protein, partial [Mya arenaria]
MTSKNMYNIDFKNIQKGSPEEVLTSFKNKKGTYARIYETLCGYAGLYCTVLTGFAKGLDYRPGDKFKGTEYNHSWNAVNIDENWYLVDSHWATRYLISEKNQPENLVYEYDDFYFMTDPEQLIYSHWAQKAEWQMLAHPLTLQEFEELPLVKSYFFKCGMFFISHQKGVVQTRKGNISITVGFVKPTNFTYKIVLAENGDEMYQGNKLKSYGLQETRHNQASFTLRAPKTGSFYLTIFAQLLTGDIGVKNVFTAAAEYKVNADSPAHDAVPLPNCSDSNWGPGIPLDQLGIIPSQKDAVIPTQEGKVTLEFQKTRPTFILCKLRRPGLKNSSIQCVFSQEDELERCVVEADQGDRIVVTVTLPHKGEYGFEVYGNDPNKDGDTYTHVCQYFLHYAPPSEQANAFYQETPSRQCNLPDGSQATQQNKGYQPDAQ